MVKHLRNVREALLGGEDAVHSGQRLQVVALRVHGRLQLRQGVQHAQRYLRRLGWAHRP